MASHQYNLRATNSKRDYRVMSTVNLPRVTRTAHTNKLYSISIVERAGSRVKIHYEGYDDSNDEWREQGDIVSISDPAGSSNSSSITPVPPYNLYQELGIKIKQALTCGRKQSPSVKINMGFDYLLFKGGLQAAGILIRRQGSQKRYKIGQYSNLDPLLGHSWHYRGINKHGDYAYIALESVEFYLHKRRHLLEYCPPLSSDGAIKESHIETGYTLTFSFVRKCGNRKLVFDLSVTALTTAQHNRVFGSSLAPATS